MLRGLFVAASVAVSSAGDACVGFSKDLEKGECAAWLEFYDAVIPAPPKGPGARVAEAFPATAAPAASPAAPPPHPPPGAIANRTDPCNTGHSQRVVCSDDGKHILALDFGGRGLAGVLPSMAGFDHLTYLMLAFNNLTGPAPSGLNYSAVDGCGYGARGAQESCCFLTSTTSNVYDESADSGVTNAFDCPLPAGAAEYCHGTCGAGGATPEHEIASAADDDAPSALPGGFSDKCRQCTPASKAKYPQCDVRKSLAWHGGHVAAAFCTDVDLVVFADAVPNHAVFLEEMPKPPGGGPQVDDFSVRAWNTQSYGYRIPLEPRYTGVFTNYSGAGALARSRAFLPSFSARPRPRPQPRRP